jgi:hypothetical protein
MSTVGQHATTSSPSVPARAAAVVYALATYLYRSYKRAVPMIVPLRGKRGR